MPCFEVLYLTGSHWTDHSDSPVEASHPEVAVRKVGPTIGASYRVRGVDSEDFGDVYVALGEGAGMKLVREAS